MSELVEIVYTNEARGELGEIPGDRQPAVLKKIELVRHLGWQKALETELVKKLDEEIFEIRQKSRGAAWRVLCFPAGGSRGRIVVLTSFVKKGWMKKERRLRAAIKRAKERRDNWLKSNRGKA